ncbi:hypothetical protein B0H17DRAFT_1207672 [Mycena rosella]|uniref:Uncharacterized protein n=1 Tax=Mycena rosella TaxID=1033263 RepID=A0AAD7D3Y4_MYCRO|nr:hypothetical protein B0H17DRAFT_1207672 [Mycena rosella]
MSGKPLDAGAPPRKRSSLCKFSLWVCLLFFGLFVAVVFFAIGRSFYKFATFSHSQVYQNQTLAEVKNRAAVVRPLIDEHQGFEIAVSVWSLPVPEEDGEGIADVAETPLYSDIVFRGLRLGDKHKQAVVKYKLPVAVFRRLLLKEHHLRASFVVIPESPSLVDYMSNFSIWRPETIQRPPVRSWPFPLGAADEVPQKVADRALDSFAISISLLEFHEIRSKCANDSNSNISLEDHAGKQVEGKNHDAEEGEEPEELENTESEVADNSFNGTPGVSDIAKHPEHAVKRHPFVVTRTQIRIVEETHIFNRKAYNKEHNKLKSTSVGPSHLLHEY